MSIPGPTWHPPVDDNPGAHGHECPHRPSHGLGKSCPRGSKPPLLSPGTQAPGKRSESIETKENKDKSGQTRNPTREGFWNALSGQGDAAQDNTPQHGSDKRLSTVLETASIIGQFWRRIQRALRFYEPQSHWNFARFVTVFLLFQNICQERVFNDANAFYLFPYHFITRIVISKA